MELHDERVGDACVGLDISGFTPMLSIHSGRADGLAALGG
jgi:hypothetical protein